jgi:hypothetical protein
MEIVRMATISASQASSVQMVMAISKTTLLDHHTTLMANGHKMETVQQLPTTRFRELLLMKALSQTSNSEIPAHASGSGFFLR